MPLDELRNELADADSFGSGIYLCEGETTVWTEPATRSSVVSLLNSSCSARSLSESRMH